MLIYIYYAYVAVLFVSVIIGLSRCKQLDNAAMVILVLLVITAISEIIASIFGILKIGKNPIYHIYSIIEMSLMLIYFLKTIKARNAAVIAYIGIITFASVAILNVGFLQPIKSLNSNILLLESIFIIGFSLYALFDIMRDDNVVALSSHPHFWIWANFLIFWSGSLFYWGYIHLFVQKGWKYGKVVSLLQILINIFVYLGISTVLLKLYKKKVK